MGRRAGGCRLLHLHNQGIVWWVRRSRQELAIGGSAGDYAEAHALVKLQRTSGVLAVHAEGRLGHAEVFVHAERARQQSACQSAPTPGPSHTDVFGVAPLSPVSGILFLANVVA